MFCFCHGALNIVIIMYRASLMTPVWVEVLWVSIPDECYWCFLGVANVTVVVVVLLLLSLTLSLPCKVCEAILDDIGASGPSWASLGPLSGATSCQDG